MDDREAGLLALLPEAAMRNAIRVGDWRGGVRAAGTALVDGGITTEQYTAEMIAAIEKLGPYVVIAPGLALAHARPSPAVLHTGFSWVSLAEPVAFGHESNDPVSLVIGFAAVDHSAHLKALRQLATMLAEPWAVEEFAAARTTYDVRQLIAQHERASS